VSGTNTGKVNLLNANAHICQASRLRLEPQRPLTRGVNHPKLTQSASESRSIWR
jgi:hypothetical protein